jgi:hypothetical protein
MLDSADASTRQTPLNALNVNTSDNPPVYDNLNTIADSNINPPPYPGNKL